MIDNAVRIDLRGVVQGVGFRPWVARLAREAGVSGSVRNGAGGVTIEAYGAEPRLDWLIAALHAPPAPSRVDELDVKPLTRDTPPPSTFDIVSSSDDGHRRISIPPDIATCPDCLREVRDPADRRHDYPFTNCTHCGPRYTIATDVPYDRPATTMASFTMCPACAREYDAPDDRRYHAQPNACPQCGPRLTLSDGAGLELATDDLLGAAAMLLTHGRIVAIKGLGGFHLACDATSSPAIERLRRRKNREHKPFAVMAADLDAAERCALLSDAERDLLERPERPIVICRRRPGGPIAPEVARDSETLGLFLPYTPLHHLLLERVGLPLVMTSGNLADEPMAIDDRDARERLGNVADAVLGHNRPIAERCDDSVVRVVAGGPVLLRRSRGWVPLPVRLRGVVGQPTLGCGAQLKCAPALAVGDLAYPGAHVGDLWSPQSLDALDRAARTLESWLDVEAQLVAHDLHPDYLSTRYALERDTPSIAVQHHHAHLASAIAEHGLDGPAIGLIFDGTGLGTDGALWGSEVLVGDAGAYERAGTFRPLPLIGGERAIEETWRLALALVDDAFDQLSGDGLDLQRLTLFRQVGERRIRDLHKLATGHLQWPHAHGLGRLFDAVASLLLKRERSLFEGQLAMALEELADPLERRRYSFALDRSRTPLVVDWRPAVRELVTDMLRGVASPQIAARFHNTVAAGAAAVVRTIAAPGELPVVSSGGCFANDLLTRRVMVELDRYQVQTQRAIPPGDGGIALGQVLVADRVVNGSVRGGGSCV